MHRVGAADEKTHHVGAAGEADPAEIRRREPRKGNHGKGTTEKDATRDPVAKVASF